MLSPLVFVLDQLTKAMVVKTMGLGQKIVLIPNFLDLVHVRNRGAAFGILSAWDSAYRDVFFYVLALGALIFLYIFLKQLPAHGKTAVITVGLIFGGALGNIVDRLSRGSVVDFVSVHWYDKKVAWELLGYNLHFDLQWPAFNVADSAITVGVIWLAFLMMFQHKK